MKRAVVILSGGLDSTTLLYGVKLNGFKTHAISFNYGQKHKKELEMAKMTCDKLKIDHIIVPIPAINILAPSALTRKDMEIPEGHYQDENMKQTIVPNRNMVMIALGTAYAIKCKARYLYYGVHAGDHEIYPDCRAPFYSAMKDAVMRCDFHEVLLFAPYIHYDKNDIVGIGKGLGVDYSLTWTCYKGEELACGKCGSCVERLEAFKANNITDPIHYAI